MCMHALGAYAYVYEKPQTKCGCGEEKETPACNQPLLVFQPGKKVTRERSVRKSPLTVPPLLPLSFSRPLAGPKKHNRWLRRRANGVLKTPIVLT